MKLKAEKERNPMMQAISMKLHKKYEFLEPKVEDDENKEPESPTVLEPPRKRVESTLRTEGFLKQNMLRKRYKKIECLQRLYNDHEEMVLNPTDKYLLENIESLKKNNFRQVEKE